MSAHQSIIACCTPLGNGAIALLRVSGADAWACVEQFAKLSSNKKLSAVDSHTIHHGFVVDTAMSGEHVDEVMFLAMRGPRTFTGEDVIEITCHNNQIIIQKIIACAERAGARRAERGEFTQRALLNNKLDVLQAESIHELIVAQSEEAVKQALSQVRGSLSHHLYELEHNLVELIGLSEASFEFGQEESEDVAFDDVLLARLNEFRGVVNGLVDDCARQQQVRQGLRIACIGSVNAGKSTLFNALLNRERAIVSPHAGTTRDTIEATIYNNGVTWTLVDTAGLRSEAGEIEQIGIDRSWTEAATADFMLVVVDAAREMLPDEKTFYTELYNKYSDKMMVVLNKSDQVVCVATQQFFDVLADVPVIKISSEQKQGIAELLTILEQSVNNRVQHAATPFLLNQRHAGIIQNLAASLQGIDEHLMPVIQYELVAYSLRDMLQALAQLTGKNLNESVLDHIFMSFCVGK
jgi:tRNA modification GTPase